MLCDVSLGCATVGGVESAEGYGKITEPDENIKDGEIIKKNEVVKKIYLEVNISREGGPRWGNGKGGRTGTMRVEWGEY